MARKLVLLMLVVASMALAVPALAAASPGLTYPAGVLIPVASKIKASSTNWVLTNALGGLTCSEVVFNATVTENGGSSVKASGSSGSTSICHLLEHPLVYEELKLEELASASAGKGTASLSFKLALAPGVNCSYAATKVPFTYVLGSNVVHFSNATLSAKPAACGPAHFDADFSLTKSAGEPATFE
jgi:hypothetical protein